MSQEHPYLMQIVQMDGPYNHTRNRMPRTLSEVSKRPKVGTLTKEPSASNLPGLCELQDLLKKSDEVSLALKKIEGNSHKSMPYENASPKLLPYLTGKKVEAPAPNFRAVSM